MAGLVPKQFISEGLTKQTALAPVAKRVLAENRIHLFRLQLETSSQGLRAQHHKAPAQLPRGGTAPPAPGRGSDAGCSSHGNNERLILVFLCKLAALLKGSRKRRQASARCCAQFREGEEGPPFPAGVPFIRISPAVLHLRQEHSG